MNKNSILTEDGKYKFSTQKTLADYFGCSYSKIRTIIDELFPKRGRGMFSPKETEKAVSFINNYFSPTAKKAKGK